MRRRGILSVFSMGGGDYSIGIPKEEALAGDFLCVDVDGKKNIFRGEVSSEYTPIGVVVIPPSHDVYGTGEGAVISLKYMNYTTPDIGGTSAQAMCLADNVNDIAGMTNYSLVNYVGSNGNVYETVQGTVNEAYLPSDSFSTVAGLDGVANYCRGTSIISNYMYCPSPYNSDGSRNEVYYTTSESLYNALSDFDGVGNTQVLTDLATSQSDWKTATTITNSRGAGYYTAACCAWRFYTAGTEQGQWYLPACGELGYLCARSKIISNADQYLIDSGFSDSCSLVTDTTLWSSSEYGGGRIRYVDMGSGWVRSSYTTNYSFGVRAFLRF